MPGPGSISTSPYLKWAAMGVMLSLGIGVAARRTTNPDALWHIVHDSCVPNAQAGTPAPCLTVGPDDVVLKDLIGRTQVLLIPTARITGIEDPALLAPGAPNYFAPNYFAHAWQARTHVEALANHPLPRDAIALAINPPATRTQNQLHIHIDCVDPEVRDTLRTLPIGPTWSTLPTPLKGRQYTAMHLEGSKLTQNPFHLLADSLPSPAAMADYTLVVIGTRPQGFTLLALRPIPADDPRPAHGEDLQDHACTLAHQAAKDPPT